jgi:phosphopantetheinyl transferase (holo-ACP synthase)
MGPVSKEAFAHLSEYFEQVRVTAVEVTHLRELMNERDRRYSERADNDRQSVAAAFAASEKAIQKAEDAQTQYNETHNELSRKLDDQNKATMPRAEIEARFQTASDNTRGNLALLLAGLGLIVAVASLILRTR